MSLTHLASLRDTLRRRDVIQKVNLPVATLPMIDPMLEDKSVLEFVDVVRYNSPPSNNRDMKAHYES
jgi:hypothetical protein